MTIAHIDNGESGSSVRATLNEVIDAVNAGDGSIPGSSTATDLSVGEGTPTASNLFNTFIGPGVGGNGILSGGANVGVGGDVGDNKPTLGSLEGGNGNVAVGAEAGFSITSGNENSLFGAFAGAGITIGNGNIHIGLGQGGVTTGSANITIGTNVNVADPTADNQLNIGDTITSDNYTNPIYAGPASAVTAIAGAATSAKSHVVVTSEALVAATTYTLTLTDAVVLSTSVIQLTAFDGTSTWQVTGLTPISGTATINLATVTPLTGAITINISIFN